jgi:hypothetical protein
MLKRIALALATASAVVFSALPGSAHDIVTPEPTTLPDGSVVQELSFATPSWYTDALHAQVLSNSAEGKGTPVPDEGRAWLEGHERADGVPLSTTLGWDNRPGTFMIFPAGCTMNFLFSKTDIDSISGSLQTAARAKKGPSKAGGGSGVYLGTAGHCADNGEVVTTVTRFGLLAIGKVVKSIDDGPGRDQAFVEIFPQFANDLYMDDGMMELGGPTGSKQPEVGDPILHIGNGIATGVITTPPRAGVVTCVTDGGDTYIWRGEASPGDSGSPARHLTGPGVGNVTHIILLARYPECDPLGEGTPNTQLGAIAGTSMPKILALSPAPLSTDSLVADPV